MKKLPCAAGSCAQPDATRRRLLAGAVIAPLLLWLPGKVAAASAIHRIAGAVFVNGRPASAATVIQAGDRIVVAHGGELAVSIGGDAFLLREGTVLELVGHGVVSGLRLVTGGLLSVFARRRKAAYLVTSIATVGIRGTGIYLNARPHRLYACTCYGHTDLRYGHHVQRVDAIHHAAYEIAPDSTGLMAMKSMEVRDHTDDELRMLEGFVGRKPLFDL